MSRAAPVVVFAYKRRDHLRRTLQSLQANTLAGESDLYVYCDAARSPAEAIDVEAVRSFARGITGFASVTVHEREANLGLAKSVIQGVGELLRRHDRLIVLEDDLLLSPHFLAFMNEALSFYEHDERVASIHGYCYPVRRPLPPTFFLRGADCWGWATWRRAWATFRTDGRALLTELEERRLTGTFDLDRSFPFTRMLQDQVTGRNDSWAIRWHASCFLQDMLTLYPGRSLVENIGNDGSGTHRLSSDVYSRRAAQAAPRIAAIPVAESTAARRAFARFLRATRRHAIMQRARRMLRDLVAR
jgi:hypothetical protein